MNALEFEGKLPKGWLLSSVGQLYDIIGGGTPSTKIEKYWKGSVSWISSADIYGLHDIRPRRKITHEAIKNSATNLVSEGSIIVVTRVGLGKIAKTKTPLCFSQDSQALVEKVSFTHPDYMLYYLSQAVQLFKHISRGTTISGVTKKQLSQLPLPLPPLNEQHRIVSKIESIFAQIDAAKEALDRAKILLKQSRQSVLKSAFEGKLVPQDPNDESIDVLLKRTHGDSKNIVFKNENFPKGWLNCKIDNICELIGGGTPSRKNLEYFSGNIVWLTPTQISKNKIKIINNSKEKITELGLKKSSAKLISKYSVLLTSRATIGYVAIAGTEVATNQGFASFVCSDAIFNYYLAYWLSSKKNLLESQATGTTFKEISKSKLRELQISLPPLLEQKRIVSKIESIFDRIDATDKIVKDSLTRLDLLKKSVLKKAFEGKLVPQDPNDEPASVLLKRIEQSGSGKSQWIP